MFHSSSLTVAGRSIEVRGWIRWGMIGALVVALGCTEPSTPGTIGVAVATTGEDVDLDGYEVQVDGNRVLRLVGAGSIRNIELSEGRHQVDLIGVAANCDATPDAHREVDVASGADLAVDFTVHCFGTGVEVHVVGAGMDRDHEYRLRIDGTDAVIFGVDHSTRRTRMSAGAHEIQLGDVARNCSVAQPNPRVVQVDARAVQPVSFTVSCTAAWRFAFVRDGRVTLASADGSMTNAVAIGDTPSWSPDGSKLAFVCETSICVLNLATGSLSPVASNTWDFGPTWRGSGNRITFVATSCDYYEYQCDFAGITEVSLDGNGRSSIGLPGSVLGAWDLDWSPSGDELIFTCLDGVVSVFQPRLCRVRANGSGFRALALVGDDDGGPAWRPDGSRIAFHSYLTNGTPEVVTANPDGSQLFRVSPGTVGSDPDWSPDGSRLVFSGVPVGLYLIGEHGTGLIRLTAGADRQPAWRP